MGKKQWLSGNELLARWNYKPFELLECVRNGLRVYSQAFLKPYQIDPSLNLPAVLRGKIRIIPRGMNFYTDVPVAPQEPFQVDLSQQLVIPDWGVLLPYLGDCLFKRQEVEEFEKTNGSSLTEVYSPEVVNCVRRSTSELELFWDTIKKKMRKKTGGISAEIPNLEAKLRQTAIATLKESGNKYPSIRDEYLEDSELYDLNYKHEKRDFVGALLQKIVEEQAGETQGYEDLYKLYTKYCKIT